MARPPLELVWTRYEGTREGPFDALLDAVEEDAEAAEGLASAYAALDAEARGALVATVLRDSGAAGRSPAWPLTLLLAVEEDPALARRIARALIDARSGGVGWAWGSAEEGGLAVERSAPHARFGVRWRGGRLEPIGADHGVPESAERLPVDEAIDRMAAELWRSRRDRGHLPESLRALAALFGPY